MSMVDNRVVRMTFDNAQFERNIKTTMETLQQFEKSLKLDGATAGFNTLKDAANKLNLSSIGDKATAEAKRVDTASAEASASIGSIDDAADDVDFSQLSNAASDAVMDINNQAAQTDLSPISDGAEDASLAFQMLETVAVGALLEIGEQITNFLTGGLGGIASKVKEFAIDPITDGFKEYETQMGSIQTIMANTGMDFNADEDIQKVNDTLDELNTYADKTIYNFTEMTRNIGTFTAAGVDLDTSANAIQGIANLAALSGSNSQQASTAMYQLSQALASGTLKLQDWNSVVNAGMGGQVFQEALKRTARAHGIAVDEIIAANGSFRESLQEGWITSEILTETLNQMAISYDKVGDSAYNAALEEMTNNGYTEEQAKEILRLAKVAEQSATKVRTWSQLWDTVKEAIGSQWSGIWRNFIGDFKQATDTFTFLSNTISSGVEGLLGGLVNQFKIFNSYTDEEGLFGKKGAIYKLSETFWGAYKRDAEGNDVFDEDGNFVRIKGAFDYLVEAITKPLSAIKDAFDNVFGMSDAEIFQTLSQLVLAFKDFAESLVISDAAATGLRHVFEGLFAVVDIVLHVIADAVAVFFRLVDAIRIVTDPIVDLVLVLGGQFGKILLWVHDKILEVREALIYALYPIIEAISFVGDLITTALGFDGVFDTIENLGDAIITVLEILWEFIDIPGIIRSIGDAIANILHFIGDLTGWNQAVDDAIKKTLQGEEGVTALDIWIGRLLKNPVVAFFKGIVDVIGSFINSIISIKDAAEKAKGSFDALGMIQAVFAPLVDLFKSLGSFIGSVFNAIVSISSLLGSILVPALSAVLGFLTNLASGVGAGVLFILTSFVSLLGAAISVVAGFVGAVANLVKAGIGPFAEQVSALAGSIGGFVGRMWDFFTAWDPVKGIISVITDFKDKVVDFFTTLPGMVTGSADSIAGEMADTETLVGRMVGWFEKIRSFIDNLTPEQFIQNVKDFANSIVDNINNMFDTIANLDFEEVAKSLMLSLDKMRDEVTARLQSIITYFLNKFPSAGEALVNTFNFINGGVWKVFNTLKDAVWDAKNNSSDLPTFIGRLIGNLLVVIGNGVRKIATKIITGVKNLITTVVSAVRLLGSLIYDSLVALFTGKGLDEIKEAWGAVGSTISTKIHDALNAISPTLATLYDKVVGFFVGTSDESSGWSKIIGTAVDTVKNAFGDLPGTALHVLEKFRDSALDIFKKISDGLSKIPGPIGTFFGMISDKVSEVQESIAKGSKDIPSKMDELSTSAEDSLTRLRNAIKKFFLGSDDDPEDVGILGRLKNFFSEKTAELIKKVKNLPKAFGDFLGSIIDFITPERVERVAQVITIIARLKLMKSLGELASGMGKLAKAFARKIHKEESETLREKIRDLAISLAIIAGSLWLISTIKDPMAALGVLVAMGVILLVLQGISTAIKKVADTSGGDELLKSASSIVVLAAGIFLILKAVERLTSFDFGANIKGLVALGIFLVAFAGWVKLLTWAGGGSEGALKAAAALVVLSFAVRLLIGPLEAISNFAKDLDPGQLSNIGWALGAVAVFIGVLAGALRLAGEDALKNSIAFIIMSAAVSILADALSKLAVLGMLNLDALWASVLGVGLIIAEFAAIAQIVNPADLLKTSLALIVFAGAVTLLSYGLGLLAGNDWASIAVAGIAISVLFGIIAAMTKFLDAGDLVKTAAALIVFSAAVGIISYALYQLSSVDTDKLVVAAIAIGGIITVFGILARVLSSPAIALGASVVLPTLSLAFIALGAACLLIAIALEHAVNGIIKLALAGPILSMFVNLIANNVANFAIAAAGLGALGAALLVFGPGAVLAGAGLLLLSNGIREFLLLMIQLPFLLQAAGNSLMMMIEMLPNLLGQIVTAITTWVTETFIPAIGGFFTMIFENLGVFIEQARAWFETTALPLLQEWGGQFITWVQTDGLPMIGSFISGIMTHLADLGSKFLEWLQTTGLPMLTTAASNFWSWVQTDGLPKLGEFIGLIFEKLGELASKFANWVATEGLSMVGKAVSDIMEKAKEIGPKILDWGASLPGHIQSAINSVWGTITSVGSYIAQGVADGIDDGVDWIINAVYGMGSSAISAIKDFFGIESPSRLMRDEVGRYIPEGLAVGVTKFAGVVAEATENLGLQTINGVQSILNNADYSLPSPSITPVMDISSFSSDVGSYNDLLRSAITNADLNATNGFHGQIGLSGELASRLDDDMNQSALMTSTLRDLEETMTYTTSRLEDIYGRTNDLLQVIGNNASVIRGHLDDGFGVTLDSGAIVGALANDIDTALGQRAALAGRGVY